MKSVLITSGAGFIGSNFIHYMLDKHQHVRLVNLDALTYAGNLENLASVAGNTRYTFVKGDVRDRVLVDKSFVEYGFNTVINFAAESHVDRSTTEPELFLTTNIIGTQTLLDAAKHCWSDEPNNKYCHTYRQGVRLLRISTDEVHGTLGRMSFFAETTPLAPNSPYSAPKASADMIVRAYHETYDIPVNITRCPNNYGPYQFPEKLIPLMIHNYTQNRALPVYGDGMQIRNWLYVKDRYSAIDTVLHEGNTGEVYSVGGNNERANIEIVRLILASMGKEGSLIEHVQGRPGHDRRHAIDNARITTELGWSPSYIFDTGTARTIDWYFSHVDWMAHVTSGDYLGYYEKMYR